MKKFMFLAIVLAAMALSAGGNCTTHCNSRWGGEECCTQTCYDYNGNVSVCTTCCRPTYGGGTDCTTNCY